MLLFGGGTRRDEEFRSAIRHVTAEAADAIAPLIAVDIDPEHRRTIAHALVGLAEGVSRRLVERGEYFDPDEIARQVSRPRLGRPARRPPGRLTQDAGFLNMPHIWGPSPGTSHSLRTSKPWCSSTRRSRGLGLEIARQAVGGRRNSTIGFISAAEPWRCQSGWVASRLRYQCGSGGVLATITPRQGGEPREIVQEGCSGIGGTSTRGPVDRGPTPRRRPRRRTSRCARRRASEHRDPEHTAPVTHVLLVVGIQPAQDRIVGERPHRRQAQPGQLGRGRQTRSCHRLVPGITRSQAFDAS